MVGRAHLNAGKYHQAIQYLGSVIKEQGWSKDKGIRWIRDALSIVEEAYLSLGMQGEFVDWYQSFVGDGAIEVDNGLVLQCYLESAEPSRDFRLVAFEEGFEAEKIATSWLWVDRFGDCSYRVLDKLGLEICAANGRDLYHLNLSAPRLMREISGDFAMEVCISPASDDMPQIGGLLVWGDRDNFLRLEKGINGQHEIRLHGYVDGEWKFAGRGLLPDDDIYLRLERSGDEVSTYCSADGQSWLTCGKMTLPIEDPIQVGIHAIGMIDRTIYCGEYREGTATVFRNFRIWTRE